VIFTKNPDINVQIADGELLILNKQNNQIHQLNEVASYIWTHIDGSVGMDSLVSAVLEKYEVTETIARQDVSAILEELVYKGIVISK
jgi:methyltransferase-like protein